MEARFFFIFIICYESLCPYCENFIVNYLIDVFTEGIDAIADVKLFPYGNAKVNSNGNITCQVNFSLTN